MFLTSVLRGFQRFYGTGVRCPLPREEFYGRTRELELFRQVLNGSPQISLISGPNDSGKTTLMLRLLEELSTDQKRPRSVLYLDLRERAPSTVNELTLTLGDSMESWADGCRSIASKGHKPPIERLHDLFAAVGQRLPICSQWSENRSPILFIDQANRLKSLMAEERGAEALSNLLGWFVKNTKQDHRFHVVLGASDSFSPLWLADQVRPSRFTNYLVGPLSREEAEVFWREKVLVGADRLGALLPPSFEDAYEACGGSIYLLKRYFSEYYQSQGELKPLEFSTVGAERDLLVRALWGYKFSSGPTLLEDAPWSRDQFLTVIRMIVEAEGNFVVYENLCYIVGKEVVDALIGANILHLRMTSSYSHDIPYYNRPILTAANPSKLLAMKEIVKEVERDRLSPASSRLL